MKYKHIILLFVISSSTMSCNKDNGNEIHGVIIKGTLSSSGLMKNNNLKTTNASNSLANARNIMVFNSSGGYELFNIEDSLFAARAMQGTAAALVFLGADNNFIGCLQAGGLNVLPLVSLKNGDNTVIDLNTLSLDGTNVIPSNNPIGNEIILNPEEIERYRQFGAFFKTLSQNIDADGDGKADLIDSKALYVSTIYDIYCGMWGLNNTEPQTIDTSLLYVNYTLNIWGEKSIIPVNPEVILSGPEGSPYIDIRKSHYDVAPDGFVLSFHRPSDAPAGSPFGSVFLPFDDGKYSLNLDNKTYSLSYSKVDAKYYFVLALPTVHTNDNNEIASISVEYKDMNGKTINPENFVYQTMIQLNNEGNQLDQIGTTGEKPGAKTNTELYNFVSNKKIKISQLTAIKVVYMDLLGNTYSINFKK